MNTLHLSQINQSTGAKRTISGMAKRMNLDVGWLHDLLSLHWNYDKMGREAMGWVKVEDSPERTGTYVRLASSLNLPNTPISPKVTTQAVLKVLQETDEALLQKRFASAVARGDIAQVQEFRTYHYYRNATVEQLLTLWDKPLTAEEIIDKLFYKVFSAYHTCDPYVCLALSMPYTGTEVEPTDWLEEFLQKVETMLPSQPSLSDLVKTIAPYCKGNKQFCQDVLTALSFAGLLQVVGHEVKEVYLPDCQNQYSQHFMSNEWPYPMRFWNEQFS